MARYRGKANLSTTYDVTYWGPFDTRMLVPKKADLFLEETWIPLRSTESSAYDGMIVAVAEDTADNNGIYYLKDYTSLTSEDSWIKLATLNQINELKELIENIDVPAGSVTEEEVDQKINQLRDELDSLKGQVGNSTGCVSVISYGALPNIGSAGIVYIVEDENAAYRWDQDELKYYSIGRDYEEIKIIFGGNA